MNATSAVHPLINEVYEVPEQKGYEEIPPPELKPLPEDLMYLSRRDMEFKKDSEGSGGVLVRPTI